MYSSSKFKRNYSHTGHMVLVKYNFYLVYLIFHKLDCKCAFHVHYTVNVHYVYITLYMYNSYIMLQNYIICTLHCKCALHCKCTCTLCYKSTLYVNHTVCVTCTLHCICTLMFHTLICRLHTSEIGVGECLGCKRRF